MDAGHLKGRWKGVVYVLATKDSNGHIVHVSTVLADKENETNYRFLLEQTCRNEQMKQLLTSDKTTIFTDGHKGSPPAIAAICPNARVMSCLRHLVTNKAMRKMGNVSVDHFAHAVEKLQATLLVVVVNAASNASRVSTLLYPLEPKIFAKLTIHYLEASACSDRFCVCSGPF